MNIWNPKFIFLCSKIWFRTKGIFEGVQKFDLDIYVKIWVVCIINMKEWKFEIQSLSSFVLNSGLEQRGSSKGATSLIWIFMWKDEWFAQFHLGLSLKWKIKIWNTKFIFLCYKLWFRTKGYLKGCTSLIWIFMWKNGWFAQFPPGSVSKMKIWNPKFISICYKLLFKYTYR